MRFPALQQALQPLECAGTPYERGLIQGKSLQKQLQLCFNALFQSDTFGLLKPRWLPAAWSRSAAARQARRSYKAVLKRQLPDAWEYMQGLAEGSSLELDGFVLMNTLELYLARRSLQLAGGSTLMIPTRFSASEEPVLIKNVDYPYFFKSFNLVRKSEPLEGLGSVEVTLAPSAGAHAGMNEAGLALSFNYTYGAENANLRQPLSLKLQQALQSCQSAAEAVRFFELGTQEGRAVVGAQDTQGDMYLIEISSGQVHSKQIRDNLLIMTNHYQSAEMVPYDIPVNAYYDFRYHLKELAGQRIRESSEARFDRLYAMTGTRIQFHQNDLLEYFSDHDDLDQPSDNTVCRHGDYFETSCSVMLRPLSRQISVALGSPCEVPYQVYQWL